MNYQCPYCLKHHDEPNAVCCGEQHVEPVQLTPEQLDLIKVLKMLSGAGIAAR